MTGLKVYVASKWENKRRVREVMGMLELSGHEITYDWTHQEVDTRTQAIRDLRGVVDADVYVGIFEEEASYKGALVEMGAALALGKPVYILGDWSGIDQCIFFRHPHIRRGENAFVRDLLVSRGEAH